MGASSTLKETDVGKNKNTYLVMGGGASIWKQENIKQVAMALIFTWSY